MRKSPDMTPTETSRLFDVWLQEFESEKKRLEQTHSMPLDLHAAKSRADLLTLDLNGAAMRIQRQDPRHQDQQEGGSLANPDRDAARAARYLIPGRDLGDRAGASRRRADAAFRRVKTISLLAFTGVSSASAQEQQSAIDAGKSPE